MRVILFFSLAIVSLIGTPLALSAKDVLSVENQMLPVSPAQQVAQQYYDYFNQLQMDKLYALVDDNVVVQFNYDKPIKGKQAFIKFMNKSNQHYREQVGPYLFMGSKDGRYGTTRFNVKGKYIKTDEALQVPANGQTYELVDVINVFEVKDGKIIAARSLFDEKDLNRQLIGE